MTLQVLCGRAKAEEVVLIRSNIVYDTIKKGKHLLTITLRRNIHSNPNTKRSNIVYRIRVKKIYTNTNTNIFSFMVSLHFCTFLSIFVPRAGSDCFC